MTSIFPKKVHIVFPDNDHADIVQLDEMKWACPICGHPLDEEPYGPTGAGAYNICDSCGVEFGYDDYFFGKSQPYATQSSADGWRSRLLRSHIDGWKELREAWLQRTEITEEILAQLANIGIFI